VAGDSFAQAKEVTGREALFIALLSVKLIQRLPDCRCLCFSLSIRYTLSIRAIESVSIVARENMNMIVPYILPSSRFVVLTSGNARAHKGDL
jgi:hypothetical protein